MRLWLAGTDNQIALYWLSCFVHQHEVEHPLLELVKHADQHGKEEIAHQEVAKDTENMPKDVKCSVHMLR